MVIESILLHYGVDPYSHHVSGADGDNAAQFRETSETRTSEEHGTWIYCLLLLLSLSLHLFLIMLFRKCT